MKKLLSLLLLSAILFCTLSLFACQTPEGGGEGGGLTEVEFIDHLDDYGHSLDFSAEEEFIISFAEGFYYEIYGDETKNEKLDTLIYNRNKLIEARFGITISREREIIDAGGVAHYNNVQLALNSGDVPFDALAMNAYQAGKLIIGAGGSNFLDFRSEIPYVKDSILRGEEWWPREINIDSTVMGRQFVAVSDFSLTAIEMAYAVIFNRDLAETTSVAKRIDPSKYTVDSTLYDVVRGNDWTLDTMTAIVKGYWKDNPALGKRGECDKEDRFGLVGPGHTDADAWAYSLGYNYVVNDGVAAPELWDWDGTQYDAILALRELYYSNGTWNDDSLRHLEARSAFFAETDRVLFALNTLGSLKYEVIHTMEEDFGVLPYPKYKREQAKYLTGSLDSYSALAVPFTTAWSGERLRMTGALIEALSAENCNSVKKPYYDEIVTHHNVTDGDSAEMIDLIMQGRVYDLGVYHYNELVLDDKDQGDGAFALFFRYLVQNRDKDIVQYWNSNAGALQLQMDDLLGRYADALS